ncbi:hypothetical protein D9756_008807 [Leucocoprinus leucothites]|uniref:DUF6533 domain-containing protein n=1 Tax=Leucocoprinus leucothites TaxID=201217 RepID=A0A8H5FUK2_9AGAR|nr:hypothetical protein D9756_008807 [Leucoagaricus leucothites]
MDPVFTITYVCCAIYIWGWISDLGAEYNFIWSHSLRDIRTAQVLYLLTRCSALLCHGVNLALLHSQEKHPASMSTAACRHRLFFIVATMGANFALLLANLMLRVYALYKLDSRILFTLAFLLVFKVANILVCWLFLIPRLTFNAACGPTNARLSRIGIFMGIELLIQGVPVYLTLMRGAKIERETRARRIVALLAYLRRDGVFSWTALTMLSTSFMSIAFYTQNIPDVLMRIGYPIFITFMSSMGCHLILHMGRLDLETTSEPSGQVPASFELDILESAWDAQSIDDIASHSLPDDATDEQSGSAQRELEET